MVGGAPPPPPPPGPLLDFEMRPVGPRHNWRDVLHKQRYQARLQLHREANPTDNLGREITEASRCSTADQIVTDPTVRPHHTLHFTMQSDSFDHPFQSTTFTVRGVGTIRHLPSSPGQQTQF